MKQRINRDQWNQLTTTQKIKWFDTIHFGQDPQDYKTFREFYEAYKPDYPWTIEDELKSAEDKFGGFGPWEFPSIGEIIQFLNIQDNNPFDGGFIDRQMDSSGMDRKPIGWTVAIGAWHNAPELIDALWEAVLETI